MTFPLVPQPRPAPRVIARLAKRRRVTRMDRIEKEAVRTRDRECCRVCGRASREVHERLFKSLGGVACAANSLVLCRKCHQYAQGHAIQVRGVRCDLVLSFAMSQAVAHDVFRGRAVPSHVEVTA